MLELQYASSKENLTTIPGKLISGWYRQSFGYRVKRSKGTKDYYLTMTLHGKGSFFNGKEVCECPEGELMLITPGTPHYYGTPAHTTWEFAWCHFVPKEEWFPYLQLPESIKGIRHARVHNQDDLLHMKEAFASLVRYNKDSSPLSERLAVNALEEVLLLISKTNSTTYQSIDFRIDQIIKLLSDQYFQPFTVAELAAKVNLSPSRFAHLFKTETGESVMEMLSKIRLRQAKLLLETTPLTVAEIADEIGYNHPFYFSRQFTSFFGTSPALYRKRKGSGSV